MADVPQYTTVARPRDYWMSPKALSITLNALGEANRIAASVTGGSQFFCHFEDIGDVQAETLFGYDVAHNFRSWPLNISQTYFNTNDAILPHIAIPRRDKSDAKAMVVFPTERLDLWGYATDAVPMQDEDGNYIDDKGDIVDRPEDAATAYVRKKKSGSTTIDDDPIGSEDYYYIYLHGKIMFGSFGYTYQRYWDPEIDTGRLNTDETWGEVITLEQLAREMKKKVDVEWFQRVFTIHGTGRKRKILDYDEDGNPIYDYDEDGNIIYEGEDDERRDIKPNDMDHEITDTQSMFGTWTEQFLSALGIGSGSGSGGGGDALEWPLLDINTQGMPGPSDIGGPQTGDAIVYDSALNGCEGGFKWGKTGGLSGLHIFDGATEIQPTISGDSYSYELGTKFLSLAHGGIVNGQVTVNGANLIVAGGTLTVSGNMLLNHADGFDPVEAANNVVLTKGEMQTLFDERYVTVAWFKKLFEARTQGGTAVDPNKDGIINNLKVLVGTWTEQYLSALGTGSQGGSGGVWYLSQLEDVNVGTLSPSDNGKALIYNSSQGRWVKGNAGMDETQLTTFLGTYTGFDTRYLTDAKLKSQYRWWGAQMDASGIVAGNMSGVGSVTAATNGASAISGFHSINLYHSGTNGAHVDFHWSTSGFTSRIIEGASGRLDLNNTIFAFHTTSNNYGGCVGIGTVTPYTNLHVSGGVRATKFYLHKPYADSDTNAVWLQYDNNGGVRLYNAGFYADTFVSALGTGSTGGSGGVDLSDVWYSLTHNEAPYANTKIHNSHLNFNTSFGSMAYESSSDYVLASEAVFAVKVNNSTYYPGAYGIVDLGTISGGGGDYLPLIGGTLTGNLRVKGAHDLSQSNNGITGSSNSYYGYYIVDANNKRSAQYINTVSPSGSNAFWISVTYDVSGALEQDKGFGLTVDKQGNCTWNVSDPAAFRTAIGINLDNLVTTNTEQTISAAKLFSGGITPIAAGSVQTVSAGSKIWFKRASATTDDTPNNGIVLEYGGSSQWVGQLFMADNGRDGLYWGGWYNGTREAWKKFAFTSDLDGYLPLSLPIGGKTVSFPGMGSTVTFRNNASDYPIIRFEGANSGGLGFIGVTKTGSVTEPYYITAVNGAYSDSQSKWYNLLHSGNTYVNSSGKGYINGMEITAMSGNAATATKLSDTSEYTAWGRKFFTGGKPQSVSGNIDYVDTINFNAGGNGRKFYINKQGSINFDVSDLSSNGWATSYIAVNGSTILGGVGLFGGNASSLTYVYIGKAYNDTWMTVLPSGNVGIGTTAPSYKLQVIGTSGTDVARLTAIGNADPLVLDASRGYTVTRYMMSNSFKWSVGCNADMFYWYSGGASNYVLSILNNGNVGIGSTNPGAKLDVSGSLRASSFLTSWNATGSNGTVGFVHIATITVTSGYASQPLKFRVTQRGRMGGEVTVRFLNTETVANTTVDQFFYTGDIAGASIVRSGATFSLYIRKAEGWDNIGITLVDFGAYASDRFTVAWANNHWTYPTGSNGQPDSAKTPGNTSEASGYDATCRYYFAQNVYMEYDTANQGVRVYNSGLYADTYVSSLGAGSTGSSGGTNLKAPLDEINGANLGTRYDGSVIMWKDNKWQYWTVSGSGSGSVVSVAMNVPTGFTIGLDTTGSGTSSSALTNSGRFYLGFGTTTANRILGSGSNGAVSWRTLVAADIPNLSWNKITTDKPTTLSGYGISESAITAGKASQLAQTIQLWGNPFNGTQNIGYINSDTGATTTANLNYVKNISMAGTVTGCTSIDQMLYFSTTNSRIGIGTSNPGTTLDVVGQMRLRQNESSTTSLQYGVSSDTTPFIRFTDPEGGTVDIMVETSTGTTTTYPLRLGSTSRQTRIYGSNVRMFTAESSSSTSLTEALRAAYGGRVLIGGTDANDTNCKLCVNGNICTSTTDQSYIKIGGAKIIWDNANQALHIDKGVYSDSFVSSLGIGSGGSGGTDTMNTAGVNRSNGTLLYLVGSKTYGTTGASDYDITYTSTKCYIGSDNCLYSNGSKVLTEASGGGSGTDTQDTAGIYQSANEKLFLIGSKSGPSQAANAHAQTYENSACYIGTDNCLYSNSKKVLSAAGGSISSGHLYLEGAQASSATSNTTQIVFGTSSAFKVALSGINSALVINSTTSVGNNNTQIGTGSAKTYFNSTGDFIIGASSVPDNLGSPKVYVKANSCIDGYVAIGTAVNTSYKLKVSGSAYVSELRIGNNVRLYPTNVSTNADVLDISAAGLRLNGNSITSDMRKKDVVSMIGKDDLTLEAVARAPIFNFRWKQWPDGLTYVGTSAQYWQAVLPNAVLDLDNTLSLDYGATALAAVTTTARTVLTHEEEIAALKRRISDVETECKAIKQENRQLKNEIELLKAA